MSKLITIVGPSGVGKTALTQALASTGLFETALEQHAERPFQAAAKQDTHHTLANQFDYLLLRAEQERGLRMAPRIGLMDGGLDLDFHGFTRLFLRRGLLSPEEYGLCRRLYLLIRATLPLPELIVRLKTDEVTVTGRLSCRNRINIASAEDTSLFESFLDEWLAGVPPEQVLELDVTNETLEYNNSRQAVLLRLSQLTSGATMYTTDMYEGILAETVTLPGANGDMINAYLARPLGSGPYPAMVLAHHMPGWDEWYRETAFKFANHGYVTLMPNLYFRAGHGIPEDIAAKVRADGGVPDDQAVGDLAGAMKYLRSLPYVSGKAGIFGTCSGGRHAYLAACRVPGFDAVVDCWGGSVVMPPDTLNEKRPVAPIDYTRDLPCPILGIFGNEDSNPTPEQVNQHEDALKAHGKKYEFHRYDGAGHGFFYYIYKAYRQEQAMDGWKKVWAFLEKNLSS